MVELADSLDSGSSAHSGRAGSSPASRTKQKRPSNDGRFCFMHEATKLLAAKPNEVGLQRNEKKAMYPRLWMRLRSHWLYIYCFFRCLAHPLASALRTSFFLLFRGVTHLNPIEIGSKQAYAVGLFGKRKNLCDRDGGHTSCVHQLPSQRFFRRPASRKQ